MLKIILHLIRKRFSLFRTSFPIFFFFSVHEFLNYSSLHIYIYSILKIQACKQQHKNRNNCDYFQEAFVSTPTQFQIALKVLFKEQ